MDKIKDLIPSEKEKHEKEVRRKGVLHDL